MNTLQKMSNDDGFTLLEVLLTVVLLSLGFLVAGKMQIHSLRSSQTSHMQANALLISAEIMDKMRNNLAGVEAGHYDSKTTSKLGLTRCGVNGCTPAQLAAQDLYEWSAHFVDVRSLGTDFSPSLPGVSPTEPAWGAISAPTNDVYTISINWQSFSDGESSAETLSVNFIP